MTYKPSRRESAASAVILFLIACVGAGVFVRQYQLNPAVEVLAGESYSSAQRPEQVTEPLFPDLPPDLVPMTAVELFSADNLSDKIDGKAEFYLSAGFKKLRCQRLVFPGGDWAEVYAFLMSDAAAAFSVFSQQKRDGAGDSGVAHRAYRTENAVFVAHGPHYLEIVGSSLDPALVVSLESLAVRFVRANPVKEPAPLSVEGLFPPDAQGSISLLMVDVFGFERLDRVYVARYLHAGEEISLFLSLRESEEEASELAGAYGDFLLEFGSEITGPQETRLIDLDGAFEGIFSRGRLLGGVHDAGSRGSATAALRLLLDGLEKKSQ